MQETPNSYPVALLPPIWNPRLTPLPILPTHNPQAPPHNPPPSPLQLTWGPPPKKKILSSMTQRPPRSTVRINHEPLIQQSAQPPTTTMPIPPLMEDLQNTHTHTVEHYKKKFWKHHFLSFPFQSPMVNKLSKTLSPNK